MAATNKRPEENFQQIINEKRYSGANVLSHLSAMLSLLLQSVDCEWDCLWPWLVSDGSSPCSSVVCSCLPRFSNDVSPLQISFGRILESEPRSSLVSFTIIGFFSMRMSAIYGKFARRRISLFVILWYHLMFMLSFKCLTMYACSFQTCALYIVQLSAP